MRRILAIVASASLLLAGCSSGDDSASSTGASDADMPQVEGEYGELPTVTFPESDPPADLQVEVLSEGDGDPVEDGDIITANYWGSVWGADEAFDESFSSGVPMVIALDSLVEGWIEGLPGTAVGSRVLLSIPSDLGYPDGNDSAGIEAGDTIVFVVDVLDSQSPNELVGQADATEVAELPTGLTVSAGLGEPAIVVVGEDATEPTEDTVTVLDEGTGDVLESGQTVVLAYSATNWDNTTGGTSWDGLKWSDDGDESVSSGPIQVTLGQGTVFDDLIGAPIGSRVLMQFAAADDDSYDAQVALVDVLTAY